jgi:hypothetical protein
MTAAKRLAQLESKLRKPIDDYVPVDLTPFLSEVSVTSVAHFHGKRRKHESVLVAYARAVKVTPAKLWRLAYGKPAKLKALHLAVDPNCRHVDGVVDAVVRDFIREEIVYHLCESLVAEGPWFANILGPPKRWGLCRIRPLKPVEKDLTAPIL